MSHVVVVSDEFKGTLTAAQVAATWRPVPRSKPWLESSPAIGSRPVIKESTPNARGPAGVVNVGMGEAVCGVGEA